MTTIIASNDQANRAKTAPILTGTATVTPATLTFSAESGWVEVTNLGNKSLYISYDGGTTYREITPYGFIPSEWNRVTSVLVKTLSGETNYQIVYTIEGSQDS